MSFINLDESITKNKLSSANLVKSGSSGNFFASSSGDVAVTNLSATIITSGKPVLITLEPSTAAGVDKYLRGTGIAATLALLKNNSGGPGLVEVSRMSLIGDVYYPPSAMQFIVPGLDAGTHTFYIYAGTSTTMSVYVYNVRLVALELS